MHEKGVHGLVFALLEEANILFGELIDQLGEEIEGVGLILHVCISGTDNLDNTADHLRLNQHLEEAFVLAEIDQGLVRVECHVQIVILGGQLFDQGANNHVGLLLEYDLHFRLVSRQLRLSLIIRVVRSLPLVFLFGLDLLLYEFDH